ncbi:Trehalose/maltose import ATP-binding protein MalK [Candidatus Burarchaeum australiense]|nr:Trehalose/maltose import ATP-binding protein MalK [Candidatus Burarchaeum australiense]
MAAAIELRGVSFAYYEKTVLRGIDLTVRQGEFVALMGPIACGKTTLLTVMNGLIPHVVKGSFGGTAKLVGNDTRTTPLRELARHAGFLFQEPDSQIFSLSVQDEVEFALRNFGVKEAERKKLVEQTLAELSLSNLADADPRELSQGQKQKVALASVLAYGPEVLLLDEPAASLDHYSSEEIYDVVKGLNRKGKTVVVVEHDTELIVDRADRLVVMNEGRLVADGKFEEVFGKKTTGLGIKEPCFSRIAHELGVQVRSEREFVEHLKGHGAGAASKSESRGAKGTRKSPWSDAT